MAAGGMATSFYIIYIWNVHFVYGVYGYIYFYCLAVFLFGINITVSILLSIQIHQAFFAQHKQRSITWLYPNLYLSVH